MGKAIHTAEYRYMLRRLKLARQTAELTQVAVAEALGVAQNFVSRCESGERRIDPIDLWRFADLYSQPLEFFLPGKKPSKPRTKA